MTEPNEQALKADLNFVDHLDSWMSKLPAAVRRLPLINLAIPGKSKTLDVHHSHINKKV